MGIAERKEREKEDVRRRILEAAATLAAQHGYANITRDAVADAAGETPTKEEYNALLASLRGLLNGSLVQRYEWYLRHDAVDSP